MELYSLDEAQLLGHREAGSGTVVICIAYRQFRCWCTAGRVKLVRSWGQLQFLVRSGLGISMTEWLRLELEIGIGLGSFHLYMVMFSRCGLRHIVATADVPNRLFFVWRLRGISTEG